MIKFIEKITLGFGRESFDNADGQFGSVSQPVICSRIFRSPAFVSTG
jgi:hypothetical protein